jgi:ribosomal protein S18 acetylase RimI-like enzyme
MTTSNLSIRPATLDDAPVLSELGRATFSDAFGADNSADDLANFLESTYTPEVQRAELADPVLTYLLAELAGAPVAFALLRAASVSPFIDDPSAVELQRFYVDRSCHGTGVAQSLMESCVETARRAGAKTMFLGVWEKNPRALRFYAAQRFTEVGRKTFQVGSDAQQDLVLARRIAP